MIPAPALQQQAETHMTDAGPGSQKPRRKIGVYERPARADLKRRAVPIALVIGAALALVGLVAFVS